MFLFGNREQSVTISGEGARSQRDREYRAQLDLVDGHACVRQWLAIGGWFHLPPLIGTGLYRRASKQGLGFPMELVVDAG